MTDKTITDNELTSPVDGRLLGHWADAGSKGVDEAMRRAVASQGDVAGLPLWQRCDLLNATASRMRDRRDEVVDDLVIEHGKIRREAESEFETAVHGLELVAEYARQAEGRQPSMSDPAKRVLVSRIPLGPVAVITPWNFPLNIPVEYLAPALAMGNPVIWKGAESTPRSTRHLRDAFSEAGWPADAVQVVEGGPGTGAALAAHPDAAAICFTGSSSVGQSIASHGGMRRLVLELGGNGPSIVFPDADLERAAECILTAATFCSGQSCAATERVLVHRSVRAEMVEALAAASNTLRVGGPDEPSAAFGPLHLEQTALTVRRHVDDAVAKGARVVTGGGAEIHRPTDRYWPVTVLDEVHASALINVDETFGPVVPVLEFTSEADLWDVAATSNYGLNGALFTRDLDRAFRVSERLKCGSVVVNDHSNVWETHLPFGGWPGTGSGIGRVGAPYVLDELSTVRSIIVHIGTTES